MVAPVWLAALELVAPGAQLGDDLVDAALLDGAHAAGGQPQSHPALLRLDPEALRVQVGQKAPARLVVGVGDSVPHRGLLASDLANAGHTLTLRDFSDLESRRVLPPEPNFIPARRRDHKQAGLQVAQHQRSVPDTRDSSSLRRRRST